MRVMDVSAEPPATQRAISHTKITGSALIDLRWHRTKDGTVFPVEFSSGTLKVGARTLMYAVMSDSSRRYRDEETLQKSEAKFRALIEYLPEGVIVHRNGEVLYMNPALRALLGYGTEEPVTGLKAFDLMHPDSRDAAMERVRRIANEGVATPLTEARMKRADGSAVPVEATGIRVEFEGAPAVLAIVRDVRARKSMEAQLLLSDRLASLGRLAASVGHEINNPLAYILGNVQVLQREIQANTSLSQSDSTRLLERLAVLEAGALRVSDIVRDLKTLSLSERRNVGPFDLARVLNVCANMAEHEIRRRARLVREFGPPLFVEANEARIGQVFLNLLVNAAQSIPEGSPDDNEIRIVASGTGREIIVDVMDTGTGISPELLDRIFEPFFTTKESEGTGLGLSISHSIVVSYGGTIEAWPRESRGTRFRVTLPIRASSEIRDTAKT
jgi:PAS domain S-box-containing protein